MATTLKNISLITVLTVSMKTPDLDLIHKGKLQKTASTPSLAGIPVNDTTMAAAVAAYESTFNGFKAVPPTFTEPQVKSKKLVVVTAYNQNAGYIQGIARSAANSAGDVNVGIALVQGAGYSIKKTKDPTTHQFKLSNAGLGSVEVTTKAVAKRACYLRQYAPTSDYDVAPAASSIKEMLISLEIAIQVNNLQRKTVYAFREASILPLKHKAKGGSTGTGSLPATQLLKTATPTSASNQHHVIFTDGVTTHYVWSEWKYILVS